MGAGFTSPAMLRGLTKAGLCLAFLLVAQNLSAQGERARTLEEAAGRAEKKAEEKERKADKTSKSPCDPEKPDCMPCRDDDEEQTSCCDPEQSLLCKDLSLKVVGVPVPVYNPQLEFSLGLLAMVTYHPFKEDKVSPPWATVAFGMYTTNKSWLIGLKQEAFWDHDKNRASLAFGLGKFNSQFYGTGSSNDIGMSLPLTSKVFMINPRYTRNLWERLYLGGQYRLLWNEATFGVPDMPEGVPVPDYLPLTSSLTHSGLGVVGEWDSRDNRFSATKGFYVPVNSIVYATALGGDANFADVDLAVNYYHSWFKRRLILANRGFVRMATSDTPPQLKPAVGMGADLRGYAAGRYRDNLFMAAQTELRWYFWWKLGAVAFAGIGTTTEGWGHLTEGTVLPSWGGGLRFLAFEEQRMVVRIDYGHGNEDGQIYFSVSEAF
jgi:hypothetical protein